MPLRKPDKRRAVMAVIRPHLRIDLGAFACHPYVTDNDDAIERKEWTMPVAPEDLVSSDGSSMTVLVIDDDRAVRRVVRLMLELEDFTVFEAEDGAEGVTVAMDHAPDFVVLDYMMPGLDGERTACQIHELVPDASIIAFSAGLVSAPYWSDFFIPKSRIGDLPTMLNDERASRGLLV
ncbi:MAG: response regulator [Actinomycetota bacterium]